MSDNIERYPDYIKRVVVADDDCLQRTYISSILKKLGYDPYEADNGICALKLLRDHNAQILICDLDMPGLNGINLARRIRSDPGELYVHILMVTGRNQSEERERALDAGIDDFMAKPVDTASLTARIRSVKRLLLHEKRLAEREDKLRLAKERIESDLNDAANAQRRMLPDQHIRIGQCEFHSAMMASNILAGDMFAYFEIDPGILGFYAIDVAGHGIHASLMSVALGHMLSAEFFRQWAIDKDGDPDPAALVRFLNKKFFRDDSTDYFTMFCGVLDQSRNELHFCQGGYPSAIITGPAGVCTSLGQGGFPVALLTQAEFENQKTYFPPDHFMVLVSDGALEAEDPSGQPFDDDGVKNIITARAHDPASIPDRIIEALSEWRGGSPLDDDLTVVVCERIQA